MRSFFINFVVVENLAIGKRNLRTSAGRYRILLILLMFAFFLTLIAGSDGWLRLPSVRTDSGWFFMSGKSWMEGLVPYRDYTDSKGPLLWLIYGVGYLVSPHNLYGVFIFEVLFYWLNFYVLYLAAYSILRDDSRSLLASMLMAPLFFYPGMHFQMRIEDLCYLFQSIGFYVVLEMVYFNRRGSRYTFLLGLSCGCTLMMKYAYFLTLLIPSGLLLIYLIARREAVGKYILAFITGLFLVALPFFIYFAAVGALDSFVGEYFLNTGSTILNNKAMFDGEAPGILQRWPFKIWYKFRVENFWGEFLRVVVVGVCFTVYQFRKSAWFVGIILAWFVGSLLLYSTVDGEGYYLMLGIFVYGGVIWIASFFREINLPGSLIAGACILAFIAGITTHYIYSELHYSVRDKKIAEQFEAVASVINSRERATGRKPTLAYHNVGDRGEHIATNAIAGTKYWAMQSGMTEEMERHHDEDIFVDKPDFVIIPSLDDDTYGKRLEANGYRLMLTYEAWAPNDVEEGPYQSLYMLDN